MIRLATPILPTSAWSPALKRRFATGAAALDAELAGGLALGHLHEIYAAEEEDSVSAAGFAAALALRIGTLRTDSGAGTTLWLRTRKSAQATGAVYGPGLAEMGGDPAHLLFVLAEDDKALLRAGVDAVRCEAVTAVVIECRGAVPAIDLTVSRRLSLAAQQSGVTLFLLRTDATPTASAAETRWQVAAAPSTALPANAPGHATFDIELLRRRSGPSGMRWRLEWNRDQKAFADAALSGAILPVPVRRPLADTERAAGASETGKRAA